MLTIVTVATAPRNARWVGVPQIWSGMPRMAASASAQMPAVAVRFQRPVSSPQHGPAINSPIRMTWWPRIASTAAMTYLQRRDPERQTKRLIRQLEALRHVVTLQPTATSTAEAVVAA